jgi:hypothetical protein
MKNKNGICYKKFLSLLSLLFVFGLVLFSDVHANSVATKNDNISANQAVLAQFGADNKDQDGSKKSDLDNFSFSSAQLGTNHWPLSISYSRNSLTGYLINAQYVHKISEAVAFAVALEYGSQQTRFSGTLGFNITPQNQIKFTAERLTQVLPFEKFASGKVEERMSQNAFGLRYQYSFVDRMVQNISVGVYYSNAPSKMLEPLKFSGAGCDGVFPGQECLNLRNIAGGVSRGFDIGAELKLSETALLGGKVHYDDIYYKTIYNTPNKDGKDNSGQGLGWTLNLTKIISDRVKMAASASMRRTYNLYEAGIHWMPAHLAKHGVEVGIVGQRTVSKNNTPDSNMLGVQVKMAFTPMDKYKLASGAALSDIVSWVSTPAVRMERVLAIEDQLVKLLPGIQQIEPSESDLLGSGGEVTISGGGFDHPSSVVFGKGSNIRTVPVTFANATTVKAPIPPYNVPGKVDVIVINADGQQALYADGFTYVTKVNELGAPVIESAVVTGVSRVSGSSDTALGMAALDNQKVVIDGVLQGKNLKLDEIKLVTVAGVPADAINNVDQDNSGKKLAVKATIVPPAKTEGNNKTKLAVVVTKKNGTTASSAFEYDGSGNIQLPVASGDLGIDKVEPREGTTSGYTRVKIYGQGLCGGGGVRAVKFDGIDGEVAPTCHHGVIVATVTPPHEKGRVTITVTNNEGKEAHRRDAFAYSDAIKPTPVILSVTPPKGYQGGGTPVTIGGKYFSAEAIGAVIFGNSKQAKIVVNSPNEIALLTPPSIAVGLVKMQLLDKTGKVVDEKEDAFTYTKEPSKKPEIADVAPKRVVNGVKMVVTLKDAIEGLAKDGTISFIDENGGNEREMSGFTYSAETKTITGVISDNVIPVGKFKVRVRGKNGTDDFGDSAEALIYFAKPVIQSLDKKEIHDGDVLNVTLEKPIAGLQGDSPAEQKITFVGNENVTMAATYQDSGGKGLVSVKIQGGLLKDNDKYTMLVTDSGGNRSPLSAAEVTYFKGPIIKPNITDVMPKRVVNGVKMVVTLKDEISGLKEDGTVYFTDEKGGNEQPITGFTYTAPTKTVSGIVPDGKIIAGKLFKVRVRGRHGDDDMGDSEALPYFAKPVIQSLDKKDISSGETLNITLEKPITGLQGNSPAEQKVTFVGDESVVMVATYKDNGDKGLVSVKIQEGLLKEKSKYKLLLVDSGGNQSPLSQDAVTYIKREHVIGTISPIIGNKVRDNTVTIGLTAGKPEEVKSVVFTVIDDENGGKEYPMTSKSVKVVGERKVEVVMPNVRGINYCMNWRGCSAHVHTVDASGHPSSGRAERAYTFLSEDDRPVLVVDPKKPKYAIGNGEITLEGANFDYRNDGNTAIFKDSLSGNEKEVNATRVNATQLKVKVPSEAPVGKGQIKVSLRYNDPERKESASRLDFDYIPEVTDVTPAAGPITGGNNVTVSGKNFKNATVMFGDNGTTENMEQTDKAIKVMALKRKVPDGGAMSLIVRNGGRNELQAPTDKKYTYRAQPVIYQVLDSQQMSSDQGIEGETMSIIGRGFSKDGSTQVTVDGKPVDTTYEEYGEGLASRQVKIKFRMPNNCYGNDKETATIAVMTKGANQGAADSVDGFRCFLKKPRIDRLTPDSGISLEGKTPVTVVGKNFYRPKVYMAYTYSRSHGSEVLYQEIKDVTVLPGGRMLTFVAPRYAFGVEPIPSITTWLLVQNNGTDHQNKGYGSGLYAIYYTSNEESRHNFRIKDVGIKVNDAFKLLPFAPSDTAQEIVVNVNSLGALLHVDRIYFHSPRTGITKTISSEQNRFRYPEGPGRDMLRVNVDGILKGMSGPIDVTLNSTYRDGAPNPVISQKIAAFSVLEKAEISQVNANNEILGGDSPQDIVHVRIKGKNLRVDELSSMPQITLQQKGKNFPVSQPNIISANANEIVFQLQGSPALSNGELIVQVKTLNDDNYLPLFKDYVVATKTVTYKKFNAATPVILAIMKSITQSENRAENRGGLFGGYEAFVIGQGFKPKPNSMVKVWFGDNQAAIKNDYHDKLIKVIVPRGNKIGPVSVKVDVYNSADDAQPTQSDVRHFGFFYVDDPKELAGTVAKVAKVSTTSTK